MCLYLSVKAAEAKMKVVYITTVKEISTQRIDDMLSKYSKEKRLEIINNIYFKHLDGLNFDSYFPLNLEQDVISENIAMVVIDSFTGLVDTRFIDHNNIVDYLARSTYMKEYFILIIFRKIAEIKKLLWNYNLFFFAINNVTTDINNNNVTSNNLFRKLNLL